MAQHQRMQGGGWPQDFFKIMQFSGNFKEKSHILSKFWAQGPSLGVKSPLGPLTKILDPPWSLSLSKKPLVHSPQKASLVLH